jgi:hypothetical protein
MKSRRTRRTRRRRRAVKTRRLRGGNKIFYVVTENGKKYPNSYSTYEDARDAVTRKYKKVLYDEWEDAKDMDEPKLESVIVDENKQSDTTELYIKGGINVTITKIENN